MFLMENEDTRVLTSCSNILQISKQNIIKRKKERKRERERGIEIHGRSSHLLISGPHRKGLSLGEEAVCPVNFLTIFRFCKSQTCISNSFDSESDTSSTVPSGRR